jgi:hypothetical protein
MYIIQLRKERQVEGLVAVFVILGVKVGAAEWVEAMGVVMWPMIDGCREGRWRRQ